MKRLVFFLWMPFFMVGTGFASNSVIATSQVSTDYCADTLVGLIQQAGLDMNVSAPAFACRRNASGNWFMPRVRSLTDEASNIQLTANGINLLKAVDRMSMDPAFSPSIRFDRERSVVLVPRGAGVDSIDFSKYMIGVAPNWMNNLVQGYTQSMETYLTRTAGSQPGLATYIQWFMGRRDAALQSMANGANPMAGPAFVSAFGYQAFPWPGQLADQAAIAAYTEGSVISEPTQPLVPTVPLDMKFVGRGGFLVANACIVFDDHVPGRQIMFVCDNDNSDENPERGVIRLNVAPGRYYVSMTYPLPTGFFSDAGNN